jgi:putative membrane protein
LEQITEHFPTLVPQLCAHEGISFVLVNSEPDGGLVIESDGLYYLDKDFTVGENPLADFGVNAARHLRRTNSFMNAPDILVMSLYDPSAHEVAAFEEMVGSHGGLGGPQTQPFLLYPTSLPLDPEKPIIDAEHLHRILKSWMKPAVTGQKPDVFAQTTEGDAIKAVESERIDS